MGIGAVGCSSEHRQRAESDSSVLELPAADGALTDGFTLPFSLIERDKGSALLSDRMHSEVWIVDFVSGSRQPWGRRGEGPGEFQFVAELFRLPDDSIGVFALMVPSRLSILDAEGRPARTVRLGTDDGGSLDVPGFDEYPMLTRADSSFRLYGDRIGLQRAPGGLRRLDSVPIMRFDPSSAGVDTVDWLHIGEKTGWTAPTAASPWFEIGHGAFAARNDWTVLPDGTTVTVDARRFHVRFRSPGGNVRDVAVSHVEPPSIEDRAWQRHVDSSIRSAKDTPMYRGGITRSESGPRPPEIRVPPQPQRFPPVLAGLARVHAAGWLVWVPTAGSASPTQQYWTVIDTLGEVRSRFRLPARHELVAVTESYMYVSRRDDDDLRWVSRHPLPFSRR